jgi:acetylornithine/N-succinyldiaminopimelate aminotransferase
VSNLYRVPEGERLSERLCAASFADTVFFANSGAEAMECVIKMVRKYQSANGHPERYRIITFEGSFHGRTLATLAAAKNKKHLDGFGPVMDGFDQVPLGDIEAVKRAIGSETAGILVEPVQGEGGVRTAPPQFFRALRALCDERDLLLAFDEVQTGIGRIGELFGYQRLGVTPDVMGLAKGLGAGFPIGACLATAAASKGMTPGTHGSTFGGNPLAMAAGNAVLDEVLKPGFLEHVRQMALLFKQRLAELKDRHAAVIAEVRGEGLLIGLRTHVPNGDLVDATRAEKLLTVAAGDNVVRLLPPLIVSEAEVIEAIARLDRACATIARTQQATPKQGAVG